MPDRQQLSVAAEQHLLVRDEARQSHGVDRRLARNQIRRGTCGAGRGVALRLVVQLDDLGAREEGRGLGGEAHHQHGSHREIRREEDGQTAFARPLVHLVQARAGRSDHARHPGVESAEDVRDDRLRRGEVDRRLGGVALDELVPGRLERGCEHASHLAAAPEQADPHAAAARTSAGLTRSTAAEKRSASGPIPAAESCSG